MVESSWLPEWLLLFSPVVTSLTGKELTKEVGSRVASFEGALLGGADVKLCIGNGSIEEVGSSVAFWIDDEFTEGASLGSVDVKL